MKDKITRLCGKLLETEDLNAVQPVAAELQRAIHDRIEMVRQDFVDIVLIDSLMELDGIFPASIHETST